MRGMYNGVIFNRCNLCAKDIAPREPYNGDYCMRCTESCLKDASELLDKLVLTYDTDLAYECMERILEGRR